LSSRPRWAETQLKYSFHDSSLLDRALTHRSASKDNNERLEFLGDSFLSFAIARRLYALRPVASEGDLSRARAALVKRETLTSIAQRLGIDSMIILGAGELKSGGAQRGAVLADTLEALIGAVLLDGGTEAAEALIELLFAEAFETLPDTQALKDAKTKLQELLQGQGLSLPVYRVSAVEGRDHEQTFIVVCEVPAKNAQTTGKGGNRRHAEQQAAAAMIAVLLGELD
jgi:ribonuclease-3